MVFYVRFAPQFWKKPRCHVQGPGAGDPVAPKREYLQARGWAQPLEHRAHKAQKQLTTMATQCCVFDVTIEAKDKYKEHKNEILGSHR